MTHGIEVLAVAPAIEHDQMGGSVGEQGIVFLTQLGTHQHDSGGRIGDQALDLRTHAFRSLKSSETKLVLIP